MAIQPAITYGTCKRKLSQEEQGNQADREDKEPKLQRVVSRELAQPQAPASRSLSSSVCQISPQSGTASSSNSSAPFSRPVKRASLSATNFQARRALFSNPSSGAAEPPFIGSSLPRTASRGSAFSNTSFSTIRTQSASAAAPVRASSKPANHSHQPPLIDPTTGLFAPNPLAFDRHCHRELQLNPAPPPPPTPMRVNHRRERDIEASPFLQNIEQTQLLIARALHGNPIDLEIAPDTKVTITHLEKLSSTGQHSVVYKCVVRGMGEYVLKLFKPEFFKIDPNKCVQMFAGQLLTYAKNIRIEYLRNHTVNHLNLNHHLEVVSKILDNSKNDTEAYVQIRNYVKTQVKQGFMFAPFIPHPFPDPSTFDQRSSIWKQLQQFFAATPQICNDLRRSNCRIDTSGKLYLVDLFEYAGESFRTIVKELRSTFSNEPEVQRWLCPHPETGMWTSVDEGEKKE